MKKTNYYIGLDIGTDSVGYAVTDEEYNLCRFKGEPMWGVTLFDEAQPAVKRRSFRAARRRLDRRHQRVRLIMELFAEEISKVDKDFYRRIKESYLYPESPEKKVRLFGSYEAQKDYVNRYPTIHHLLVELMKSNEPHDVRLVYVACAWLVAHRGHFLLEVDKNNIESVTDFDSLYTRLVDFICRDGYALPWSSDVDSCRVAEVLKKKLGITKKSKALAEVLFNAGKPPKAVNEAYEYNYDLVIKLLCGGKVSLKALFDKDEYDELEEKSVALNMEDEKLAVIMQNIGDDSELIAVLKAIYDWSVLVDVLRGEKTISEAKVRVYEQHRNDLSLLKKIIRKYIPEKYNDIFRSEGVKTNYPAYVGMNEVSNRKNSIRKNASKEDFSKYILSVVKNISAEPEDEAGLRDMIIRLENNDFMPKQVEGDNRVIPYQLYWHELNVILKKAAAYIPFLSELDADGISGAEKVISVFEFRVPYYVGPLKEKSDKKLNHWMVRRAEGKIYPWNFDKKVDLDMSEEAFIARMTNSCTYLPGEDVLPKCSLVYSAFEVLNEINNIKIDGNPISVELKQDIYENVFLTHDRVSVSAIKGYIESTGVVKKGEYVLSGLDVTVKSNLKPFRAFRNLVKNGFITLSDAERIISRATYSEDKSRFVSWLTENYPNLPSSEIKYVCGLKFKEFGRLSRMLLCGIEGVYKKTGEAFSIIRAMWETNFNFMELLSDKFTFAEQISDMAKEYYGQNPKTLPERLDEMYVSNAVKRPIIRTLDILKDIVKVQGGAPKRIFIEMARGAKEEQKGRRTDTRLKQILDLYEKIDAEEVRALREQLEALGDEAHNRLQSDKLFLYFIQLGKCLYTGNPIDIESVVSGDGKYNIEHIYPRSFVKDDSIINNKILVDSKANGDKSDSYPIDPAVQEKMRGYWQRLNKIGLLSDEKLKRLTRTTHFTDEERFEFINRQLVETRQSTKVVATLLKELYPDTEVVYVKAGLVSDFRQEFKYLKSRVVNDLHHAKDAYLNIVTGNVWHHKFSRRFWRAEAENNAKVEIVFTRPLVCYGKTIWKGVDDKDKVLGIVRKNTAHVTKYAFLRKGGLFDQMPVEAAEGLVPLKKNRPTEVYGGYNKSTASFFAVVKYQIAKKADIMLMPVELLYADRFIKDNSFADDYAKKTVGSILGKEVIRTEFLLNKRILKVNTMLSLDGLRVCITGKSGGGKSIGVCVMECFKTSRDNEAYIKKLESFENKKKKNRSIVCNEAFDGISKDNNLALYDCFIEKLQKAPYMYRPANPVNTLISGRERFIALTCESQAGVLLGILGLFGRAPSADLTDIGGVLKAGVTTLSSTVSNWKKNYNDVRIIDQSASGLFETVSDNILELL